MSQTTHEPSLADLVRGPDGNYVCPRCNAECSTMDGWTQHVGIAHDPFREFVRRWQGQSDGGVE